MNICSTFYALKRYGLKGMLDYILDLPHEWNFKRRIFATSNPAVLPQPGITLITCFRQPNIPESHKPEIIRHRQPFPYKYCIIDSLKFTIEYWFDIKSLAAIPSFNLFSASSYSSRSAADASSIFGSAHSSAAE